MRWTPARIQVLRAALELDRTGFAAVAGVPKDTLDRWEQGRHAITPIGQSLLDHFCRARGVDVQALDRLLASVQK